LEGQEGGLFWHPSAISISNPIPTSTPRIPSSMLPPLLPILHGPDNQFHRQREDEPNTTGEEYSAVVDRQTLLPARPLSEPFRRAIARDPAMYSAADETVARCEDGDDKFRIASKPR
jgi:hypothetical protein